MAPRKRGVMDLFAVQMNTDRNLRMIEEAARRLQDTQADPRRAERLFVRECRACFYLYPRLCGQGFTEWECSACGKHDTWADTCVPWVCSDCADKLGLCKSCGADRDLKRRRKLDRADAAKEQP